jgi:hypothetical protein
MQVPVLCGPYGSAALEYAERFTTYGADTCWFHGFDDVAFETCTRHHIAPCVEFKTFRADFDAHPELIPIGVDGRPIRYGELVQGICLSQREYLEQIEDELLAGLRTYQPRGIWLDYLTYAGWFETPSPDLQDSCFCPECVENFSDATGVEVTSPHLIFEQHADLWTRHKCERIARFALHYAELIRAHLPECIVGAYMCPWLPDEFAGALKRIFAQDYALLTPAIDVFTPLIYAGKSGRSAAWGREFLEQASEFVPAERKVQLILDALDFPASLEAITASRRPSWGVQLFGGAQVFRDTSRAAIFQGAVEQIREAIA